MTYNVYNRSNIIYTNQSSVEKKYAMEADDDRDFTTEEIKQSLGRIDYKKAPEDNSIKSKTLMWTFEGFPRLVTSLYISCLRKGCFHKKWKCYRFIPLTKPGKRNVKIRSNIGH